MQVNSIQNTALTNTFKDFRMPDIKTAQNTNLLNITPVPAEFHNEESHKYEKGGLKKAVPFIGAIIGTVLPLVVFNKVKGKTMDKEILKSGKILDKLKEVGEYFEIDGVPKILSTAAGAISGGLLGGCIIDKNKEDRKEKVKEAVFEMTNITVPTLLVAGILKFMQSKKLDKGIGKFAPVILGLGAGIPIANKISMPFLYKLPWAGMKSDND